MTQPVTVSWTPIWGVVVSIVVYAVLYVWRWRRVRTAHGARGARGRHLALWLLGLAAIYAALCTPIDSVATDLASAHMVQHLLLADVAPILLILALTKIVLRPVTRVVHAIERRAGWFGSPVFGVLAYVGIMWIYHIPAVYDLALRNDVVHTVGHIGFFTAGSLYWWHLLSPIRSRIRLGGMAPVAYMATTKIAVGALGVLLTFYPQPLYRLDQAPGERWGMTQLIDQQVAGAVMGLEQALVMGVALAFLFFRMLQESESADRRADVREAR